MYDTEQYIGKVHHLQNYGFIIFCRSCAEINSYKQEQIKNTNEKDELKYENDKLKNENDKLKNENDERKNENDERKNENDELLEKYYQLEEEYEKLQNDNYLKIFHNI
jgi:predicted nuclease with TOPRIM domain